MAELEDWLPMPPEMGPPFPRLLGIYWPWYKKPPPKEYVCPYCGATFDTYEALVAHVQEVHPGEEVPPPFTGFSLMIENPVAGAAYWFADFPYSVYTGKIGMLSVDKAGWITQEAPGMDYIRILFLDANYQCPTGDPYCEGLIFSLLFEDGHHYILNCSTGELRENPSPPSMPEVPIEMPRLIDVTLPTVSPGGEIWPEATIYLPIVLGDNQYYSFSAVIEVIGGTPERPIVKKVPVLSAAYVAPVLREMDISQWGESYYLPLDSPDAMYHVSGVEFLAPPGRYPVRATIRSAYALWVPGPYGGIGMTEPRRGFDFGVVGMLEVT